LFLRGFLLSAQLLQRGIALEGSRYCLLLV